MNKRNDPVISLYDFRLRYKFKFHLDNNVLHNYCTRNCNEFNGRIFESLK